MSKKPTNSPVTPIELVYKPGQIISFGHKTSCSSFEVISGELKTLVNKQTGETISFQHFDVKIYDALFNSAYERDKKIKAVIVYGEKAKFLGTTPEAARQKMIDRLAIPGRTKRSRG